VTRTLLRGGCVLTLGTKTPNFTEGDVLIDGDRIAEVGTGLRARDAEVVEAADTIVMPGFVDTHRHAWRSLFRNMGAPGAVADAYGAGSAAPSALAERFGPDDVYAATLVGLLGAVEAGITTVVDWSDLPAENTLAEAALQAHTDAGLRTVFVDGARGQTADAIRERIAQLTAKAGPSTTIAFGTAELGPDDTGRAADGWAVARDLGLHVHAHWETVGPGPGVRLSERGLLGQDVTFVHCSGLDEADLDALKSSGASVSLTPSSEMAGGLGSPPIQELIDRDIRLGLGIDDERVAPGDMFAQIRQTISLQHATVFERKLAGKAGLPKLMSTRDVIRSATVEGARAAGVRAVTGSLEPGLQADVIVLRTDRPNVFPINDPIGAVVWGMDTSNVDWVFAAGRVVMREGRLQADLARVRDLAATARERVVAADQLTGATQRGDE
jgi:cytosine/adenosine deaminase-related metal-dependent hydrolase